MPRPKAIVVASAHWDTPGPIANAPLINATIHDFHGFPAPLYALRYPAPGDAELAGRVAALTGAKIDSTRGLDHGAWVPLMLIYPQADIPVVQLSVQGRLDAGHHTALGKALSGLREEGVLVLGSGGFVHNLGQLDRRGPNAGEEPKWSVEFCDWMDRQLTARDEAALAAWRAQAPHAAVAQPTPEHFMPRVVAYGAGGTKVSRMPKSVTYGSLRMDAYAFG